jgi:hypothetical protein
MESFWKLISSFWNTAKKSTSGWTRFGPGQQKQLFLGLLHCTPKPTPLARASWAQPCGPPSQFFFWKRDQIRSSVNRTDTFCCTRGFTPEHWAYGSANAQTFGRPRATLCFALHVGPAPPERQEEKGARRLRFERTRQRCCMDALSASGETM